MTNYKHVSYLWDDAEADQLDIIERLVYRSNKLGADQRITNTGGGNTSSKVVLPDPLTGEEIDVLYVKGSGGDLRTANRANFASLYMDKLMLLKERYQTNPAKGAKTAVEDEMVDLYPHTIYNLNPRANSIDTPLHAFIPSRYVDHTHPNAVIAIAAAKDQQELTKRIYGDEIGWVAWQRPGFDLGLVLEQAATENPEYIGVILGQHGLINWADDDKTCYKRSLDLIEKAALYIEKHDRGTATFGGQQYQPLDDHTKQQVLREIMPRLRGLVSQQQRMIGTIQSDDTALEFVNSHDAPRLAELGTSCPDHFLRTKIKPLYIDWNPQIEDVSALLNKLEADLTQYRADYTTYYETHKHADSPAMRDPNPTVILIPGIGMIAWGKSKSESRVTAEFYNNAIAVMRGAEAISEYVALPQQEAFDIEYWALEEAKLRRMPPEKELARHIVVVIGAGSGIGKATAHRVAQEGAVVVCADLDGTAAEATAAELTDIYGMGIGVAGTEISGCGPAIAQQVDITNRTSVKQMFDTVVMAYGGVDDVIITAGIYVSPDREGRIPDDMWGVSFDVNVIGSYIVADEAWRIWQAQHLRGSMVLTTSVNGLVSKKGSLAYDTSKAAANHLVRELAMELAPLVRVNGLAPATVVEGSSMFPRDRVMASLTKYAIAFDETETTEALRDRLATFYAQRTLTQAPITLTDQAEAAYLLISSKLTKTTGQIITVDGGLHEAFLR